MRMSGELWATMRARQWWHFLGLPLATLDRGHLMTESVWRLPAAVAVAGCCLGAAYGVNAVCERHTDLSVDKNPLVARPDLARAVLGRVLAVAAVGLMLAAWLGAWALTAAALSLTAGLVYSASGWGKRAPVLGLVGNTLIFAPLMLVMHPGGALPPEVLVEVGLFVVLLAQNQLLHERADVEEDAAAGAWTTGRWLGARRTSLVVVALGGPGAVIAGLAVTTAAQVVALACVATATWAGWSRPPTSARRWHRWCAALGGGLVFVLQRV